MIFSFAYIKKFVVFFIVFCFGKRDTESTYTQKQIIPWYNIQLLYGIKKIKKCFISKLIKLYYLRIKVEKEKKKEEEEIVDEDNYVPRIKQGWSIPIWIQQLLS